jgi:hypothetical protein
MALVLADRVKETTTTAGTGTVTLLGAAPGFQSFAVVGDANTTYYTIAGQTTSEWEVGIGTYTSSGTTLLGVGLARCFLTQTLRLQAEQFATGQNGFTVGPLTIASGVTITIASGQRHVII